MLTCTKKRWTSDHRFLRCTSHAASTAWPTDHPQKVHVKGLIRQLQKTRAKEVEPDTRIEQLDGILARTHKDMEAASAKKVKILEERKLFEQKVEVDRENLVT